MRRVPTEVNFGFLDRQVRIYFNIFNINLSISDTTYISEAANAWNIAALVTLSIYFSAVEFLYSFSLLITQRYRTLNIKKQASNFISAFVLR
jgi:hypothetical protein